MARGKKKETLTPEERLQAALVPESEQPYKVPENWCWTALKHISSHISDGSHNPPKDSGKGIPLLSATNIRDHLIDIDSAVRWITEDQWTIENQRTKIETNDVLLTIVASIGRTAVVKNEQFALQRSVAVIKPKINSEFLSYYFESPYIQQFMLDNAKGTAQKGFYLNSLVELFCCVPPLAEQQRIVDRIESLFAKLDEAKQNVQDALDNFETRKAAILHRAFTGELTAQWRKEHGVGMESWEARTSTQLFEYVTSGSRGWAKYYADNGDIFVRMGNLNHGTIELDLSDIQYVNLPGQTEGQRTKLQKNDILISITADIGMVGIVREMEQNAYINQHIALARPTAKDNAEFLAWYLISDVGLQQMRNKQRGATKIGLGLDDIRSLELLIPTREEQDEVVYILDNLLANEQQAKEVAEGVLEQIDLIKKAILARAFRGELGTNDPSEESAVELVKRVLAVEPPPKARAKAVSIPREVEKQLKCELERKIMKLYYYSDSRSLPINTLMEVSSKKLEVLESIRNLEQRGIIKKLPNGNYKLVR